MRRVLAWSGRIFSEVPHIRVPRSWAAMIVIVCDPIPWNIGWCEWGPWCIKSSNRCLAFDCVTVEHLYYER